MKNSHRRTQASLFFACEHFAKKMHFFITQEHALVGMKYKGFYCVQTMDMPSLWRFHEVYMLLLILVIPTCIMIVAYGSISWEIWHVMQRRYDMTSGQA